MDRKVIGGALSSLVIRVSAAVLMLGMNIFVARSISPSDFGIYNYIVVTVGFVALLIQLGLDKSAIRIIPEEVSANRPAEVTRFILWSSRWILWLSPVAMLATGALMTASGDGSGGPYVVFVGALMIPLLGLLQFWQQIERSFHNIARSQFLEQIVVPLGIIGWVLFFLLMKDAVTLSQLVTGHALVLGVSAAYLWRRSCRHAGTASLVSWAFRAPVSQQSREKWLKVSLPLAAAGLMSYFLIRGEIVVMGAFASPDEIARYAIALRVANIMIFGLSAATAVGGPRFSQLHFDGNRQGLQTVFSWSAAFAIIVSLPVAVVAWAFPELVLSVFGETYSEASMLLVILVAANFINVGVGPVAVLLMVTGEQVFYLRVVTILAIVKLLLLFPATFYFGIEGVVVVSASATVGWTIALAIGVWRKLDLVPLPLPAYLKRTA